MRRELPTADTESGKIVHVVGRVTDEVFSFLGPATSALAQSGLDQSVVMIDDTRYRRYLSDLHQSAKVVLAPTTRNPVKQWREVLRACRLALASGPLYAVHLHGILPCLIGASAVRAAGLQAPVFYSPHRSQARRTSLTIGALALFLIRPLLRPLHSAAIVNVPRQTLAFERWESVALVESPVSDVFHTVTRNEARYPLIVTGGRVRNAQSVDRLAQLSVLLGGEELRISFNWIGTVDAPARVRLKAANVSVFDVSSDAERATRLAAGWIYVALGGARGSLLAEAMAAGLPCVAADHPQHREVIRDGETGFLCRSERDVIGRVAALIDSAALRARIGKAAREEAKDRFAESSFSTKLLEAYAVSAVEPGSVEVPGARN